MNKKEYIVKSAWLYGLNTALFILLYVNNVFQRAAFQFPIQTIRSLNLPSMLFSFLTLSWMLLPILLATTLLWWVSLPTKKLVFAQGIYILVLFILISATVGVASSTYQ